MRLPTEAIFGGLLQLGRLLCPKAFGARPGADSHGPPKKALLLAALVLGSACGAPAAPTNPPVGAANRGGVTFVRARCASASSCLLGQVVTAETATPLAHATVFLEREEGEGDAVEITTLTDDQGVFAIEEPPAGRYRLQVFKRERRLEVHGLDLGEPGTTMVPVRLPQG